VHSPELEQPSPVEPQSMHVPPSVPHVSWPAMSQTFPLQQPVGHEAPVHLHSPPTHWRLLPHGAPPPQVQLPAVQPSAPMPHA
jgi:hypothetical protein